MPPNHSPLRDKAGFIVCWRSFWVTFWQRHGILSMRVEQLAVDARYGLRQVRRNPVFSAIAIATLALGIGGVTAMFSAVDAVLIRPLPYADADRLVMIWDAMGETDITSRHNPTP